VAVAEETEGERGEADVLNQGLQRVGAARVAEGDAVAGDQEVAAAVAPMLPAPMSPMVI
jgi:hypothetical protein